MTTKTTGVTVSALTLGRAGFAERVACAARAGFSAIGLSTEQYLADRRAGADDDRMAEILLRHDVRLSEVEFLSTWGRHADAPDEKEQVAFHIARRFGADRVNAGLFQPLPLEVMSESLSALCRRAGDIRIALEFMPFGGIPDLRTAWEIVRRSDSDNAGLLLDVWHWVRSGMTAADLDPVPAGKVYAIQLADVGPAPLDDQRFESLHHRIVPGRGEGRVADVLRLFARHGLAVPVSAEVMSDALLAKGTPDTANEVFSGVSAVLASSGYPFVRPPAG